MAERKGRGLDIRIPAFCKNNTDLLSEQSLQLFIPKLTPLCLRFLSCKWKGLPWVSKSNKWQVDLEVPLPQPGQSAIIDYRLFPLSQVKVKVKVAQSCPTLWHPMDYTVHGILQARTLEWVAIPFSRGSFQPRDWTQFSCIAGWFFTWATNEAQEHWSRLSQVRPLNSQKQWS